MSKMSNKLSLVKCEPQNILTNIYIKQENIDESVEHNDSNDVELSYQWSVQDSKCTTDDFEVQIKTEVDIIDDVIYESFFMREKYNYDPSTIMCHTSTACDTKSKPTNCNLNIKASTINSTPPKHRTVLYKKKQYFSQNEGKSEKSYKCYVCDKSFLRKGTLKTHLWIHMKEKPYTCSICNKSFSQASTLITHKIIHNAVKPFNCDICKKSFAQKINMTTHMMLHKGDKSNDKTCNTTILLKEYCMKTLTVEDTNKSVIHNKLSPQETTLHTLKSIKNAVISFKCGFCSKTFSRKGNLKTHIRIHTKEKPYKCDICNKSFSHQGYIKIHKRIHTGEKPYNCNVCKKTFSQPSALNTHQTIHQVN